MRPGISQKTLVRQGASHLRVGKDQIFLVCYLLNPCNIRGIDPRARVEDHDLLIRGEQILCQMISVRVGSTFSILSNYNQERYFQ